MLVTGIDKVVYGVEDMTTCRRFFIDWGLHLVSDSEHCCCFRTMDGGEIELRRHDDETLPPPIEPGSTVRELIWGVADEAGIEEVRARLGSLCTNTDAELRAVDPNGLTIGFRVTMRIAVQAPGALTNTADNFARVDERAPVYPKAEPVRIGHAVFFAPDVNAVRDFYQERLGFVLSDAYPDAGYFLRAGEEGAHHDLFVLSTPDGKRGLNHISFVVRDIHEVFGGGMAMDRAGWGTQIGPGRHPVSSAYFWYLHCPAGAVVEYFADEDHCTVAWQARDWVRSPENYAEWAVSGGIDGHSRRLART